MQPGHVARRGRNGIIARLSCPGKIKNGGEKSKGGSRVKQENADTGRDSLAEETRAMEEKLEETNKDSLLTEESSS